MSIQLRPTILLAGAAGLVLAAALLAGCATVPEGSPETGYSIHGFVGQTTDSAAPGATVLLLDGDTDRPLASKEANLMGQYVFSGLKPGYYKVKVQDKTREVILGSENKRLDINLSSADGSMNYAEGAVEEMTAAVTGKAVATGPNDPQLAKEISGIWWGYSGSTETKIALCEGGRFQDFSESSYSGVSSDAGGNETMNWGSASQGGGQGAWTIQGNKDSGTIHVQYDDGTSRDIQYQSCGDPGCLLFDGRKLCYTEGC